MKKRAGTQSGFTLIETLIALVILSIAFSAIMFSVSENARILRKLQETVSSNFVSEDVMTRAQLGLLRANAGMERMLGQNWRWNLKTKITSNEFIQELEVTVFNPAGETVLTSIGYNGVPYAK